VAGRTVGFLTGKELIFAAVILALGVMPAKAVAEPGNILNFKGGGVRVPGDSLNLGTSNFTFEAWVKKNSYAEWATIFRKGKIELGYNFAVSVDGSLVLYLGDGKGSAFTFPHGITDNSRWHHLAITGQRNGAACFYCDGKLLGTSDISRVNGPVDNDIDLTIGKANASGDDAFSGYIRNARFYKTVLTGGEIQDNFQGNVTRRGLVGWWKLDEGKGKMIYDSVGQNNGVIEGDTAWGKDLSQ